MHPLHDYVARQLEAKVDARRIVVFYDERAEFRPFVDELRGAARTSSEPVPVALGAKTARLVEYAGSMFELRAVVEPLVSGDDAPAIVLYLPGAPHDAKGSVLMELEKAGTTWKPSLKQLARNVLLQRYTLGVVDELLPHERRVTYEDLLKVFWEHHDPTQGMRQGNDVGTHYRSAIFTHSDAQMASALASRDAYQVVLTKARYGAITTEIAPAGPFYFAEDHHQQYLSKNPAGYCPDHGTGVACPIAFRGVSAE